MTEWRFFIDRGGTFTDVLAFSTSGEVKSLKLLSKSPYYEDSSVEAIRRILGDKLHRNIKEVRLGTTLATNALLERRGAKTLLLTCEGFEDSLQLAYQNRPKTFALEIRPRQMLYEKALGVRGRIRADGKIHHPLNLSAAKADLEALKKLEFESVAIALPHADRYPEQEQVLAELARSLGFENIVCSHTVDAIVKFIRRANTCVLDAYLNPVLQAYVHEVQNQLPAVNVLYMQSHGGLCKGDEFKGHNSLLSGPAGGLIGALQTSKDLGFDKIVTFDMGGTSTDVAHSRGELEIKSESEFGGQNFHMPMLDIYTVAAGGGSLLHSDGKRIWVGPDSAGADPGPSCYRRGGPLTITDCQLLLGRLVPDYFPRVFGPAQNQPLDIEAVKHKFNEFYKNHSESYIQVDNLAQDFLRIAVENMANAIRRISTQRGYDLEDYTLVCFGGAGAQIVCAVAENLNLSQIYIPPQAGLLSAYGIGVAPLKQRYERSVQKLFEPSLNIEGLFDNFEKPTRPGFHSKRSLSLRYRGSNTNWTVTWSDYEKSLSSFYALTKTETGFVSSEPVELDRVVIEYIWPSHRPSLITTAEVNSNKKETGPSHVSCYPIQGKPQQTPVYWHEELNSEQTVSGPAIIAETHTTIVVDPGWRATRKTDGGWLLEQKQKSDGFFQANLTKSINPALLEVFYNRFMNIAEQMGVRLQKSAHSVNIKERLDFSCAIFDHRGHLVANAPHMPVHLGSMEDSLQSLIAEVSNFEPGDEFMLNSPYAGGTHLPDITVIRPVFVDNKLRFFVASRGHHADVGGITPGSMPASSTEISHEGLIFGPVKIRQNSEFLEGTVKKIFDGSPYPCRQPLTNINDLKAQCTANHFGERLLVSLCKEFGTPLSLDYVGHIQDYAEECVRKKIKTLNSGQFECAMDNGSIIKVQIKINQKFGEADIDFTGTTSQTPDNFNAPIGVTKAAVAYVFRCLLDENIPLNHGCLRPLNIYIPDGSLLNPKPPAAVVAGNVETSQLVTDALFGALGVMAGSQGTMNNFSFGNETYQYYETIAGGGGAGHGFSGSEGFQNHMTNSRLTDPEVLELNYPVVVNRFSFRPNSAGEGAFSGGNGCFREIEFLQPMEYSILSSRRKVTPPGLRGGGPGKPGQNLLIKKGANPVVLPACSQGHIDAGDRIQIKTPGGGGFGKKSSD